MKALVVYDSVFGNTEKIAQALASAMRSKGEVDIVQVKSVRPVQIKDVDLLVIGSPTRGFRPTEGTTTFLKELGNDALKGIRVAAFDTRMDGANVKPAIVRWMMGLFGYAANPIGEGLKKKGGELITAPEGFYVTASEGPLKEGELERAAKWAGELTTE